MMLTESPNNTTSEKNTLEKGTLYLVGTPIGNLSDLSPRAIKVLSECDFIAAEDTRVSGKLTSHFGIKKSFISYYEQNSKEKGPYIISRLKTGEICALVTDAGMPAISDPGQDLVRLCVENDINVSCVPGPSAFTMALALSSFDTKKFMFLGFLPTKQSERDKELVDVSLLHSTLIFYEAPHRLLKTLYDLQNKLGNRRIAICRELTKINEEVIRCDIAFAINKYSQDEPRGEFVLVIEGLKEETDIEFWKNMDESEHVLYYINLGFDRNTAMKKAAKDRGVGKSVIYDKIMKKD